MSAPGEVLCDLRPDDEYCGGLLEGTVSCLIAIPLDFSGFYDILPEE